jgi:hypothetical protein
VRGLLEIVVRRSMRADVLACAPVIAKSHSKVTPTELIKPVPAALSIRGYRGTLPMFGVMRVGFGKLFPICQEGGVGSGVVCALPVARKVGCNFATCAANDVEDLGRRVAA